MENQNQETGEEREGGAEIVSHKSKSMFETFASSILQGLVFVLPLFVLPFGIFVVDFNKAMLFYVGVLVAFICFLIAQIKKNRFVFPRSMLVASLFALSGAWLLSSFFSPDKSISLLGAGHEVGTFAFFLFIAIAGALIPAFFRSENHILSSYLLLFVSALLVFLIQVLHTGFGVAIPPWSMFSDRLANVIGGWTDFGIFFGLTAILSLMFLEFSNIINIVKKARIFLWIVFGASFIAIFFVNLSILWYTLGIVALVAGAYHVITSPRSEEGAEFGWHNVLRPALIVGVVFLFFGLTQGLIGKAIIATGIDFSQVYPSWGTTASIVGQSLSVHPFVGSGPNTFSYDWLVFKPGEIANTEFWNTRFQSGAGRVFSMVAETGIFGALALLFFLGTLLYSTKKVLSYKENDIKRVLLVTTFSGTIYLWMCMVVYSPGIFIAILSGIFIGIFVATLVLAEKVSLKEIAFPSKEKKKKRLLVRFVFFVAILASFYGVYLLASKYLAGYYYTTALQDMSVRNDIDATEAHLKKAIALDPQDVYFQSAAEVGLLRLQQIINQSSKTDPIPDAEKAHFQSVLSDTVQSAKNAVSANPVDPTNWMELGRVYETILPFDPKGLKESAVVSYQEALRRSPYDPTPLVALARIELQLKNTDDALKYLQQSLKIKNNFTTSHLMIAQVDVDAGKLADAISELETAVNSNPNSSDNLYLVLQIGILYYQDGDYDKAQALFEKLVAAKPDYADAHYALGLLYDKKGISDKALAEFEAIDKLVPNNADVQKILGNLRAGKKAIADAPAAVTPVQKEAPKKK